MPDYRRAWHAGGKYSFQARYRWKSPWWTLHLWRASNHCCASDGAKDEVVRWALTYRAMINAITLVRYNTIAGTVVLLVNIGALIGAYVSEDLDADEFILVIAIVCALSVIVVVMGARALLRRASVESVLRQQTIILLAGAIALLGWMSFIAVTDLPPGRFVLNPALLIVSVVYPFYLLRQTFLFDYIDSWYIENVHLIAGAVAAIVAGALVYKIFAGF